MRVGPVEVSSSGDQPPQRRRPGWHRAAEPVLLLATVVAAIGVTRVVEHREPSRPAVAQPATPPDARRQPVVTTRFVVPFTARPGETIAVVAYRDGGLCGPTTIHLDAAPVPYHVRASAPLPTGSLVELYLAATIPPTAAPGSHRLTLSGAVAGHQSGVICGHTPERHGRLAEAEIIVVP